jgi:hypothetical protein
MKHIVLTLTSLLVLSTIFTTQAAERTAIAVTRASETIDLLARLRPNVRAKVPEGVTVRQTTLHGGKQEGVELVTINNGRLSITVIPTRGMSVLEVVSGDVRLGWNSPVKDPVHPSFVNLEGRGGLGWLDGFNEWMVRCGLEFAGHPGLDRFTTNTGDTAEMMLTLHGKIGNIPANDVQVLLDGNRIGIRGVVDERLFFGPKLRLEAELWTEAGSNTFTISDRVTNHGAGDQEMQLIYHGNYGRPLLGKGSKIHVAAKSVHPMNDNAAKSIDNWPVYDAPTPGYIEQVYLIHPLSNADGKTQAVLATADAKTATSIRWSTSQLPYLTIWKNTTAEADGYVTGIEPATGFPYNRSVERKSGRLPKLAAGASRTFSLDFAIHSGKDEVAAAIAEVADIQGKTETEVFDTPLEDLTD